MGNHAHPEAKGETPKNRTMSWACVTRSLGAPAVVFSSQDLSAVDPEVWYCTQDHRAVIAARGLEWIESELWKRLWRNLPLPRP